MNMNQANKDVTAFSQNQFADQLNASNRELRNCTYKKRAVWAWVFFAKLTIIASGVALSTGLDKDVSKALGVIMALITAIEAALRNHNRLILLEDQHIALAGLINDIKNKHTERMPEVISLRDLAPEESMKTLNDLNNSLRLELYNGTKKICDAYKKKNKALLKSLAVSKTEL